uniref:Uncharacterized protein n=1 Tax=Laticauda laticaudata TaxID=8630 RepID=A0A8C5SQA6_LATLA
RGRRSKVWAVCSNPLLPATRLQLWHRKPTVERRGPHLVSTALGDAGPMLSCSSSAPACTDDNGQRGLPPPQPRGSDPVMCLH